METINTAIQFNREFNTVRALTEAISDADTSKTTRVAAFLESDIRNSAGEANWNKLMSVESHISSEQPSFGKINRELDDEDKIDILGKTADVLRASGKETFNLTHLDAFSTVIASSTGHSIEDVSSVLKEFIDRSQGKENLQEFELEEEFPSPFDGVEGQESGVESFEPSELPVDENPELDIVDIPAELPSEEPAIELEEPVEASISDEISGLENDISDFNTEESLGDLDGLGEEIPSEEPGLGVEEEPVEAPVEDEPEVELDKEPKEDEETEEEPKEDEDESDDFDFEEAKGKLESIKAAFEAEMEKHSRKAMFESTLGELEKEFQKSKSKNASFDAKAKKAKDEADEAVTRNRTKLVKTRDLEKELVSKSKLEAQIEAKLESIIEARKEQEMTARLESIAAKLKSKQPEAVLESREDKIKKLREILNG